MTVIIILLIIAALSALLLLPAIYSFMVTSNLGLTGGMSAMAKTAGLRVPGANEPESAIDAAIVGGSREAW